jgi:hypothetical protein
MQHAFFEHFGTVLHEQAEQVEGLGREVDVRVAPIATAQLPRLGVERERGESHSHRKLGNLSESLKTWRREPRDTRQRRV